MIVRVSFSVNLRTWCFRDDCSLVIIGHKILQYRAAQPVAHGPHLAHDAVLCGPQGLFAWLISSWKGLLSIFWQIKRSKPKPSSVWFSRNQIWFAAKTFFFGLHLLLGTDTQNTDRNQHRFAAKTFFFYLHLLLGTDTQNTGQSEHRFLYNKLAILWSWILVKLHLARNNFSPVNVAPY